MPTPTTHTPGPWHVDPEGCVTSDGFPCVSGSNNALLAMMAHSGEKGVANAALMASAPTLKAERDEAVALLRRLMDVATEAAGDRQTYDFKPRAENAAVNARLFLARLGDAQ